MLRPLLTRVHARPLRKACRSFSLQSLFYIDNSKTLLFAVSYVSHNIAVDLLLRSMAALKVETKLCKHAWKYAGFPKFYQVFIAL